MKTAGIVCEYNPFHKGHEYHLAETRKKLGEETAIICVMSGNFVQRGSIASFNKHARAEAAVKCGADLVIELPLFWSAAPAEKFATGAVSLMESTGVCDYISFGSECGDKEKLSEIVDALTDGSIDELIREELSKGVTYAKAREAAVEKITGVLNPVMHSPNDILGIEYMKAVKKLGSKMEPVLIKRKGAEHDGETSAEGYLSASAIRKLMLSGEKCAEFMPKEAYEIFEREINAGRGPVDMSACEQAVLYRLRTMTDRDYESLPENSEGLYKRLMKNGREKSTVSEVMSDTKSKRYPMSRIRRMVLNSWLGVTDFDGKGLPPYISVLAMNKRGMEILAEMKEKASLPIVTKPASAKDLEDRAAMVYTKCARADDLYALCYSEKTQRTGGRTWRQSPVIIK